MVANTIFHVSCLVWLGGLLKWLSESKGVGHGRGGSVVIFATAVIGIVTIHTAAAWAWAVVYVAIGEFTDMGKALYFSMVTSTTLGYGDITLTEDWQLLAGFDAMGGLILFGASTAFLLGLSQSWFSHLSEPEA